MDVIRTEALVKRFGTTIATNQISIHVKQGEVYGFLGLNGAGKTTIIRMLLGMIAPDEGSIHLFNQPVTRNFAHWNDVGYLVETPYSYPNLSVYENLQVTRHLRQLKDPMAVDRIIDKLKLVKYKNTKASALSLGNQQRLGLAKALIHQPRLLILDEPINGLDPEGIVEVRELLENLAANGSTIFLSSHILGEISRLADRLAIIHEGKLVKELTQEELSGQITRKVIIETSDQPAALELIRTAGYEAQIAATGMVEISSASALDRPESITQRLTDNGLPPRQIFVFTEDLETYFLRTIKGSKA